MAKTTYDIGLALRPKKPDKKTFAEYVEITELNVKNAIITGRIIYQIKTNYVHQKVSNEVSIFGDEYSKVALGYEVVSFFDIPPRFTKGWWMMPNYPWDLKHPYVDGKTHYKVFWDSDWEYDEWSNRFKVIQKEPVQRMLKISEYIKLDTDTKLYIKPTDPILTYIKD